MPFDDPWLRAGQHSPLEWHREQWTQTKNPIHVVRAYQMCRELMLADVEGCAVLPDWILAWVDRLASTVQDLFGNHGGDARPVPDLPSTLTEALGFKHPGRGIRRDAFTDWAQDDREQELAGAVWRYQRDNSGVSLEASVSEIAERKAVSEKTVWRAWSRWHAFLDELAQRFTVTTSPKS